MRQVWKHEACEDMFDNNSEPQGDTDSPSY